jgi:hypothetical protein
MMNHWELEDLLDDQSQGTRTYQVPGPDPALILTLAPLLAIANEIALLMVPVRPRPAYRYELRRGLVSAARQQRAHRTLLAFASASLGDTDRRWFVGAAVVGSALSVAGLLAYVWRQRARPAA